MKYCEECGAILLSSAEKCSNCGHNVDDYNVNENLDNAKIDFEKAPELEKETVNSQPNYLNKQNVYRGPQNYNQQRFSNQNVEKVTFLPLVFAILSLLAGIITVIFFSEIFLENFRNLGIIGFNSFTYFTLATAIIALITGSKALKETNQTSKTLAIMAIVIASGVLCAYVITGFVLVGRIT